MRYRKILESAILVGVVPLENTASDTTTIQQICELENALLEMQLQACRYEMLGPIYEDLLAQVEIRLSKQNIKQLKLQKVRLPSAPRIKKSWRVKPTIRGRLPYH